MLRKYLPLLVILFFCLPAVAQKRVLTASPGALDFGPVTLGAVTTRTVTVANTGALSVKVSGVSSSSAEFVATGLALPLTLTPGASASLTVAFTPVTVGAKTATVSFASNAQSASAVSLSANVTAPVEEPLPPPPASASTGYGNVGDPYEGATPGSAVLLSACQVLMPNTSYRLTRAVSASTPTDVCFLINGANTTLDLNGYQVSGRIVGNAVNINGTHIFNGSVECLRDDALGGNVGCVWLYGDHYAPAATLRVHHLTVMNRAACGRSVHISWDTTTPWSGAPYVVRLYNITSAAAPGPSCSRAYNLSVFTSSVITAEAHNNDVLCPADTAACQGIVFYGNDRGRMHHNRAELPQNYTVQSGRAFLCDGGADYCEVDSNLVIANNNRAFRVRDSKYARIHNNVVQRVTCCGSQAVHLGDPDTGSNDLGAVIENNSFEVVDGLVLMIRAGYNAVFRNNTLTCAGCAGNVNLARVRNMGISSITFENNPTATALGTPQINVESAASATLCNSGQASGTGVITYTNTCQP